MVLMIQILFSFSSNYDDNASANDLPHSRSVFSPNANNQSNSNASSINNCSDISAIAGALAGIGPIPISPHVNVPHTSTFNHVPPPPLPPRRREKKEFDTVFMAQIRQAPDAPQVYIYLSILLNFSKVNLQWFSLVFFFFF